MKRYLVTWGIEVEADTSEDAARQAFFSHRDPDSIATVYEVQEKTKDGLTEKVLVDIQSIGVMQIRRE